MAKLSREILKQQVCKDICEIPILYASSSVAFSVAEDFKGRICVPCWYECREIFHADYPKANHIFINHKKNQTSKIEEFVNSLESCLGMNKKTNVYKSVKKTATVLYLSPFWNVKIRFSLFTLLLRAASYKNLTSFDLSICKNCKYLHETRSALQVFVDGNTEYIGSNYSWYSQFKFMSKKDSKELLKKSNK